MEIMADITVQAPCYTGYTKLLRSCCGFVQKHQEN